MNFRKLQFVLIFVCCFVATSLTSFSQDEDFSTKYPHITADLAADQELFYAIRHTLSLPGVWGLGAYATYDLPLNFYTSLDIGYGWVIGKHENDFDKKWRGWLELRAGYTLFQFTAKKSGRWITEQTDDKEYYYKIKVPNHHKIKVEAGYMSIPTTLKISPDPNGTVGGAVQPYSFAANNFTIGIKWSAYSKTKVRVIDSGTGKTHTGSTQRLFEFEAGMMFPIKDEVETASGYLPIPKSEVNSMYVIFRIPYSLNTIGTFDIGMRSLGYNDSGQLFIGNTFFL